MCDGLWDGKWFGNVGGKFIGKYRTIQPIGENRPIALNISRKSLGWEMTWQFEEFHR